MNNGVPKDPEPLYVIGIGASAGGINALCEVVSQIDRDINAAILIVLHLSKKGISDFLVMRLQQCTKIPCHVAIEGEPILRGQIYVARANYHLIARGGNIHLGHGPEENRWRPSIDVLFRSIATEYNGRSIGIVLTGYLYDGNLGMVAIQRTGGKTIVQDPNEAEYPDMPLAVLNNMDVDYCVSLSEMGRILTEITSLPNPKEVPIPEDLKKEAEIAARVASGVEMVEDLGPRSPFSCPDCGGALFQVKDHKAVHYRCHIGHAYSEEELARSQIENLEGTLWVALRMMEERRRLIKKFEDDAMARGFRNMAQDHLLKGEELQNHIEKLKQLIFAAQNGNGHP